MTSHQVPMTMAEGVFEKIVKDPSELGDKDAIEPIAIVGLSFEFPQEATSADAFWNLLMTGRNTATEIPRSRLSVSAMYHPDRNRKGQVSVCKGHFLQDDIAAFDAPFFSMSTSDASFTDPQQRKLLEHTYKALENAGIPLEQCSGSRTSVYIGAFTNDWQQLSFKDSEVCGTTTALGVQPCVNANRISWFYNFKGNSVNIDTACSSSLVALDLGCKGLRDGESDMCIVGGSNLIFSPDYMHALSEMNMLSADGQCYSFDHRGTGYGRGEGFGVLVLKRLPDALKDRDTIRAVIRNTRCNQDGYTPGITQPNAISQETLIKETYSSARLSMMPTRYFEAHGTGTLVGDPTEAKALGAAFAKTRTSEDPLWVGSVKSNIGHLEGCSGLASVIKTILILEKGIIPPNANFEVVNPKIDMDFLKIKFPLQPTEWPGKGLRRASVNSFGFAGTNAHAILDDALHYLEEHKLVGHHMTAQQPLTRDYEAALACSTSKRLKDQSSEERLAIPKILFFSAQDQSSLKRQISKYQSHFEHLRISHRLTEAYLDNVVYTLDRKRNLMAWSSFAIIESLVDLHRIDVNASQAQIALSKPALCLVFTGQGAQWPGMGRELMVFPVYEKSLRDAELYLTEIGCPWLLREEILRQEEESNINHAEYSQPICTALQIALVDLLHEFGIQPAAVVGHSSGEIAAAYSHGSISFKATLRIAYQRGVVSALLARNQSNQGRMLSVGMSRRDIQPYIDDITSRFSSCDLTIACINSNRNVTISGCLAQIDALKAVMDSKKIFARRLQVEVAYHSPHMQQIADSYRSMIGNIEKGEASSKFKTMISSVTGNRVEAADLQSAEYWVTNMVSPVNFAEALGRLVGDGTKVTRKKLDLSHRNRLAIDMLVEVGPHSALQGPIRDELAKMRRSSSVSYTSLLRRGASTLKSMLRVVGETKSLGYPIDLVGVCVPKLKSPDGLMVLPDLPEYCFDHSKTYWYESRFNNRFRTQEQGKLDLLGKPVSDWNPLEPRWRNHLRVNEMPWMEDHVINGATIYPGAGMLVMAIEAAHQMSDQHRGILGFELQEVQFVEPLTIPQDPAGLETQFSLRLPRDRTDYVSTWSEFRLCAYQKGECYEACRGFVRVEYMMDSEQIEGGREMSEQLEAFQKIEENMTKRCLEPVGREVFVQKLRESGFDVGPAFLRMHNSMFGKELQAKADIQTFEWPESEYPQAHIIHPTTLDAVLQMSVTILTEGAQKLTQTMVPNSISYLKVSKDGLSFPQASKLKACAWMTARDHRGAEFDHTVLNEGKNCVLVEVKCMRLTIIAGDITSDNEIATQERPNAYQIEFKPDLDLFGAGQGLAWTTNTGLSLEDYLDILTHKQPGLNVLHVRAGADAGIIRESTHDVPDREAVRRELIPGLSSLNKRIIISEGYGEYKQGLLEQDSHTEFRRLDSKVDPEKQAFEAEAYDASIVHISRCQVECIEELMKGLLRLLKKDAWLFLLEEPQSVGENGKPNTPLQKHFSTDESWNVNSDLPLILVESSENLVALRKKSIGRGALHERHQQRIHLVIEPASYLQAQVAEKIKAGFLATNPNVRVEVSDLLQASDIQVKENVVFVVLLELDEPLIVTITKSTYTVLQRFLGTAHDILWIGAFEQGQLRKPEYAAIDGLARVMRNEHDDYRLTTIFFELQGQISDHQMQLLLAVFDKNHCNPIPDGGQAESEYMEIDGILNIPRLVLREELSRELHARSMPQRSSHKAIRHAPPLSLTVGSPGFLETLHFMEDKDISKPLMQGEVEIRTEAMGLNFKDCLVALAQVSSTSLGSECAGTVTRVCTEVDLMPGDRVVTATRQSFRTIARGASSATCKIPSGLSFVEAATIPTQFMTAWAVIYHMARLRAGESILIHAAAGGTGQACVQVAQVMGAEVFATVGSMDKKRILIQQYGIEEDHIFDSRNVSFAKGVKRMTKGRGIDVVINSLTGEAMLALWDCIARHGRFVEIGKKDIVANSKLPMRSFAKNAAFMGFDLETFYAEQPIQMKQDLETLLDMFEQKKLHVAHPLQVHSIADVQEAFRLLASGQSAGKFVLEVSEHAQVPTTLDINTGFSLNPNATYVIAGGLGGLGRTTARWMVSRGARNLILLSRSGVKGSDIQSFIEELRNKGVRVETPACDISNFDVMYRVLGTLIKNMPPIKGCVQGTMIVRVNEVILILHLELIANGLGQDALFQNMTFEDWKAGTSCKTIGSWNLHTILPTGMDFFVLLSSASGIIGLRGQSNYNAGNTYEDAFARYRVMTCGEKTISLNLGAMIDDGFLAENPDELQRVLTYGGLNSVSRANYLGILDYYCDPSVQVSTAVESQLVIGVGSRNGKDGGLEGINLGRSPLFRHVVYEGQAASSSSGTNGQTEETEGYFRSQFSKADSLPDAANVIIRALVMKLAKTLPSIPQRIEDVDTDRPIQSYSVDSLLAVELRNWIKKEFRAEVAVFETQGASTFSTLGRAVAERTTLEHSRWSL